MKWIDFEKPNTVEDAVKLLSDSGGTARAMAGGTDLIVQLRAGHPRINPDVVVDIKSIPFYERHRGCRRLLSHSHL